MLSLTSCPLFPLQFRTLLIFQNYVRNDFFMLFACFSASIIIMCTDSFILQLWQSLKNTRPINHHIVGFQNESFAADIFPPLSLCLLFFSSATISGFLSLLFNYTKDAFCDRTLDEIFPTFSISFDCISSSLMLATPSSIKTHFNRIWGVGSKSCFLQSFRLQGKKQCFITLPVWMQCFSVRTGLSIYCYYWWILRYKAKSSNL